MILVQIKVMKYNSIQAQISSKFVDIFLSKEKFQCVKTNISLCNLASLVSAEKSCWYPHENVTVKSRFHFRFYTAWRLNAVAPTRVGLLSRVGLGIPCYTE